MAQIVTKKMIRVTVTTAGTAVPINDKSVTGIDIFTPSFTLFALNANSGANFYFGDSTVDSSWIPYAKNIVWSVVHGSGELVGTAGLSGEFDLSKVYIDSASNGDIIVCEYFTRVNL